MCYDQAMVTSALTIIPYARRFRRDLLRLVHHEHLLHVHLDWDAVDDWINYPDVPIYLAWADDRLVGVIAASSPLGNSAWLRLLAVTTDVSLDQTLTELWDRLRARLVELAVEEVGILIMEPWLTPHLQLLGFTFREDIITLRRRGPTTLEPLRSDIRIRPAEWREMPQVVTVDHAAFEPLWQLSESALRQASRSAYLFTVAELRREIIAYQITTLYQDGAHLSRLATLPRVQGSGVGGALLTTLIQQLTQRHIVSLSVNTQRTNQRSQRLYHRYGFEETDHVMPVWSAPTR